MDWDFIIHCILAVGLSAALIALLDSRIKLRKERRKTSMFYGISRDLEGDTWKQKDIIEEQNGTILEQDSTIQEQSSTIREQMHEIESLGAELKESRAMAKMLLERAQDGQGRLTAFTERLLMLIDETANVHYESASSPATLSRRLKETLQTGLTGREVLEQIGDLIETSYPGFLSGLFDDFPWLTDDDRLLICLMCCGLSPNAASVILDRDLNRLNKWKTSLARQMGLSTRLSKYLKDRLASCRPHCAIRSSPSPMNRIFSYFCPFRPTAELTT